MFERINTGWIAATMGEYFPAIARPPRIHRRHHALATETGGDVGDYLWPRHRGTVDRDLVCTGQQQGARILGAAHAAAHGQRHEAHFCGAPHDVDDCAAPLMACTDIQKAQLVRTGRIISLGLLHRIPRIAQVDKVHALDHAAIGDVETGNDANADGHARSAALMAVARSNRPS